MLVLFYHKIALIALCTFAGKNRLRVESNLFFREQGCKITKLFVSQTAILRYNKIIMPKAVLSFHVIRLSADVGQAIKDLCSHLAPYWERKGERMALNLFRWVSSSAPAYRAFLKKHRIHAKSIKTIKDFKTLPLTSKDAYLRHAKYLDLFPYRDVVSASTISATSGSTGEPFYFPRNGLHDEIYRYEAEIFLKEQFEIDKKSTLVVLGFGLGIWIGGIFTYKVLEYISAKGYRLTVVPVGTNKEQFLKAVQKFACFYDQVILAGYPPFIKDVLDEGVDYGIKWSRYRIRILTAAEGYSEKFREYIAKKTGVDNMLRDIVNMYGTVELGTMAHESAFGNLIRHLAVKNKKLFKTLFPEAANVPTLCQYYPHFYYFEEVKVDGKREVVCTGYGTHTPLIRYRFNDLGGVIPYEVMMEKLADCGIDIKKEMNRYGLDLRFIKELPFVYVWARSDFSVVFRGANIYPEEIRIILDDKRLNKFITGRFTMIRRESRSLKQILEINVELKKRIVTTKDLVHSVQNAIVDGLRENNSEYNYLFSMESQRVITPAIALWPYHHSKYFSRTGKQPWVQK